MGSLGVLWDLKIIILLLYLVAKKYSFIYTVELYTVHCKTFPIRNKLNTFVVPDLVVKKF